LKEQHSQHDGFKSRHTQLSEISEGLEPLVSAFKVFLHKGVGQTNLNKSVSDALMLLGNVKNKFAKNPEWILQPEDFDFRVFQGLFSKLKNELQTSLIHSWHSYYSEKVPVVNKELLNVLKTVGAMEDTVLTIYK